MKGKSKKVIEAEKFVDDYIKEKKFPPSYRIVADHFKVSASSAQSRLRHYKHVMNVKVEKTLSITDKDLVMFGNYLLSKERKKRYSEHPEFGKERLKERLSVVNHSDIEHFRHEQRKAHVLAENGF